MDFDETTVRRSNWIYRRFFLSNLPLASKLFCFNHSNGFTFGEIELFNDELQCQIIETNQSGLQINHLCWLPNTICRPSKKQISVGLTTLPTENQNEQTTTLIYNNQNQRFLDKPTDLTPSSIDSNDFLAVSYLNGTVKIYDTSSYQLTFEKTFYYGNLHQLKWNPIESHLLLLSHQNHLNIFDTHRQTIDSTLSNIGKEHLADCTWLNKNLIIGRHRHHLLIWDRRVSREPIRNEVLDRFGQIEKLKYCLMSPENLISVYDSRLSKLKLFDLRFLTMRQVETFDENSSAFLDYYWLSNQMAILIATHQGSLHWIDVNLAKKRKF